MVIDTSALLAVLFQEGEADAIARLLASDERKIMTPFNALEADIVVEARKGPAGQRELELLLHASGIEILPFTGDMRILAAEAWRCYGKGRHAAGLNIGDCCAYAVSSFFSEPLLFKGEDFSKTDVKTVAA
ncbi:MAG: type II toxin-antitoxin system VapC family toxin [Spirochaetaceae bacterium]